MDQVKTEKKWIKLWVAFLEDETFLKWSADDTLTYLKFMCLAAVSSIEGVLYFSDEHIARKCHTSIEYVQKFKKKLCEPEKINPITQEPEGVKAILLQGGYLKLINYKRYQPDWSRIKKYANPETTVSGNEEEVFKHWISCGCMKHDSIAEHYNTITKALARQDINKIKEAISNYGKIINDNNNYWYNHSYRLKDFMTRGMEPFFTQNKPFDKYKRIKGQSPQKEEVDSRTKELLIKRQIRKDKK